MILFEAEVRYMYEIYNNKGEFKFYRIQRTYIDENGIKRKKTFRSKKSVTECKQLYRKELRIVERAKMEKLTFRYFAANYYYTHIQHAELSKSYKQTYCTIIFNYLIPQFGDNNITDITHNECQAYLNSLIGYSKGHIVSIKKVLRRLFNVAIREDIIKYNPTEYLVLPFCIEHERRAITDDERRLLYQVCENHPSGAMALTMLLSGLRPMEIQNMTWDWIDYENHTIKVKKSKSLSGKRRCVPLFPDIEKRYMSMYEKRVSEYVFQIDSKHTWNESRFYKQWHSILDEMKRLDKDTNYIGDDFTPYLLRHTFCTDCQNAGVPINIAKEFMGHYDVNTTAKIYTHTTDEMYELCRRKLNMYYSNQFSKK